MDMCLIIYSVLNAGAENSHWSYLYVNLVQRWANLGCFCGLTIKNNIAMVFSRTKPVLC